MQTSNPAVHQSSAQASIQALVIGDASVPDREYTVTLPDGSAGVWAISTDLTCRWGQINLAEADVKPLQPLISVPALLERLQNQMWQEDTFVVRKDGAYGVMFEVEYCTQESEIASPREGLKPESMVKQILCKTITDLAQRFPTAQFCLPPKELIYEERLAVWAFIPDGYLSDADRDAIGAVLSDA